MQTRHDSTKARATTLGGFLLRGFVAALVVGGSVSLAQQSQYPVYTADHLNDAMKTVGLAFQLTNASIGRNDVDNAKDYLARTRDWLAPTITFWRDRQTHDAIAVLRDTLRKIDSLDEALSAETVDFAAARSLARDVNAACESCHATYREQDPATKAYRVKPDLVR